jgi:hypothetical protein
LTRPLRPPKAGTAAGGEDEATNLAFQTGRLFMFARILVTAAVALSLAAPCAAQTTTPAGPAPATADAAPATVVQPGGKIAIPSGDLVSVAIQQDVGSRISSEGDTFAVLTLTDYYVHGSLVLPKGSPGYGVITHIKRAGSFHAGGEMTFTVKRLVAPDGTEINVETNGATADADKSTEKNGSEVGQYLMWGVGMFAKRGNDMLVKKGATFHVSTLQAKDVPVIAFGAAPAQINPALVKKQ